MYRQFRLSKCRIEWEPTNNCPRANVTIQAGRLVQARIHNQKESPIGRFIQTSSCIVLLVLISSLSSLGQATCDLGLCCEDSESEQRPEQDCSCACFSSESACLQNTARSAVARVEFLSHTPSVISLQRTIEPPERPPISIH